MASPVWQVSTTLAGGSAANAVIAIPGAPLTANDVILVTIYKENTAAVTPHSGYTEKGTAVTTTAPQAQHTFWFRAAGGETGNLTFSWTGAVFRAATAHRITGCITTGDPIQDVITAFSNTNVSTLAVSLAAGTGDTLLYLAQTNWIGGTAWSSPGGFTERSDIDVIGDTTKANAGAGASGSVSQTATVSGPMTSVLLSLTADSQVPNDAGLWVPQNTGIVMPQSALYFPFTTPWAGQDLTSAPEQTADATLSGTATATASATGSKSADAALAGTGTLSASVTSSKPADASLSGTGTLTASATVTSSSGVDAALAGTGTLTATATATKPVTAALSGTGTLTATATADKSVSAALTGTGVLTGAATSTKPVAANLTATGTLTASATVTTSGASADAALSGTGTLTSTAVLAKPVAAALNGTATATAQMVVTKSISGVLVGTGSFTASADSAGQVTVRPNTGTTTRPGTGRTVRPNTGITERP